MSRTLQEIQEMAKQDYEIGLKAHYKPLADFVNQRGYKRGVEIGTAYGGNAVHLLANTRLEKFYTVDPYKYYPAMPGLESQEDYNQLMLFSKHRLSLYKNCEQVRFSSEIFFESIQNGDYPGSGYKRFLVDFFFIDGDHEYYSVLYECREASKYIRAGGALMGHDYNIFEGVTNAVKQYKQEISKEVHFLHGNIWYINM